MRQIMLNLTVAAAVYAPAVVAADYLLQVLKHQVGVCPPSLGLFTEAEKGHVHGRVDHQKLDTGLHQAVYRLASSRQFAEARPWYERAEAEKDDVHGRARHEKPCVPLSGNRKPDIMNRPSTSASNSRCPLTSDTADDREND